MLTLKVLGPALAIDVHRLDISCITLSSTQHSPLLHLLYYSYDPVTPSAHSGSTLNPFAPEFVPFAIGLPPFDDDDELADDSDLPEHADRVEHLVEDTSLWSKFRESDVSGEPPPP